MRKNSLIIGLLGLMAISQTFSQQITKDRASSKTTRSLFTKKTLAPSYVPSRTGKTYSTHTSVCPKPKKIKSQRYNARSFETSSVTEQFTSETSARSSDGRPMGSRVLEYARKHPKKVIGIVSGIGAAAATHDWAKKYSKELAVQDEIQKLSYGVGFYNPNNIHNKKYVDDLLNDYIQKGIVNAKNQSGQTPVMILLSSDYVSDSEKAPKLALLFNHGAIIENNDKKSALNLALGLHKNTYSIRSQGLKFEPKLKTLKLILPHIDKKDIEDLKAVFDTQVASLQKKLQTAQNNLDKIVEEQPRIVGFLFNKAKQKEEAIARESVANLKKQYKTAKNVQKTAQNALKDKEMIVEETPESSFNDSIGNFKEHDYTFID